MQGRSQQVLVEALCICLSVSLHKAGAEAAPPEGREEQLLSDSHKNLVGKEHLRVRQVPKQCL